MQKSKVKQHIQHEANDFSQNSKKAVHPKNQPPIQPHMSEGEQQLFKKYTPEFGNILEFGCGGSTLFFAEQNVKSLTSVESDPQWINALAQYPIMTEYLQLKRWIPLYANIGPIKEWGYPVSSEPQESWANYHRHCWDKMPNTHFDFILIDGRFRVACFLQALLHCSNQNVIFFIHDFWNRPHYHPLLNFCDTIEKADTAIVLKGIKDINKKEVQLLLQGFQYVSA